MRQPLVIFSVRLALGTPGMQGLRSNSALFWAPEKAGVRLPLLVPHRMVAVTVSSLPLLPL